MASEKTKEASKKIRENVVGEILELMERDGLKWSRGFDPTMFLARNDATPTRYRGVNRLQLACAMKNMHTTDPRWCTFNQARESGWKVKQGAHGTKVECWKLTPVEFGPDGKVAKWYTRTEAAELRRSGKEPQTILVLASTSTVFNYADIEGPDAFVKESAPHSLDDTIEALIVSSRCPVYEAALEAACYRPIHDEILIPPRGVYTRREEYATTLLHEMAHSTCVPLKRDIMGFFGSPKYAFEELRAELACVMAASELGIPLGASDMESHACYLATWKESCRKDANVMIEAISDAQKIADYLVSGVAALKKQESAAA